MPAVSVIMPAYNVEAYIDAAIGSVRRQTFTDLEVVIVDDGSTDRTYKVARRHANVDPRIRMVHQENGGLSSARNTALRHATAPVMLRCSTATTCGRRPSSRSSLRFSNRMGALTS